MADFIHVFNEPALELLAPELDTVTDFTRYLTRRERIIRSGHLGPVAGEHDLLAHYLLSGGPDEDHDFKRKGGGDWQEGENLDIPAGTYTALVALPAYKARRAADQVSYKWDTLLGLFTDSILKGEAEGARGQEPDPAEAENGLRSMALEPRLRGRLLGSSFVDALKRRKTKRPSGSPATSCRVPIAPTRRLVLAHHGDAPGPAYDEYRKRRRVFLHAYCLNLLQANGQLKRAVGLGFDASSKVTGRTGSSEDFYALEVDQWTPELDKQAEELKKDLGLLKPENVTDGSAGVDEFPRTGGDKQPAAEKGSIVLVRDRDYPHMWRLCLPNGQLTDMVNLTRAKDALRSLSRRDTEP